MTLKIRKQASNDQLLNKSVDRRNFCGYTTPSSTCNTLVFLQQLTQLQQKWTAACSFVISLTIPKIAEIFKS